jgi:hypothetical protein
MNPKQVLLVDRHFITNHAWDTMAITATLINSRQ